MGFNNFTTGNNSTNNNTNPFANYSNPLGQTDVSEYIINYNEKFKNAGNTLYRDALIQQTLSVLIAKNKPNALLIGAAGVGKTRIVEDIAYRLANNDTLIPNKLKDYTIYELPLSNIVANSGIVGEIEGKIQAVIEFFTDKKNKAIMFIDEIHMLVGESQTYEKIAQILKPALARGDLKVIGATTLQESNNLNEDPAFNRRFSSLIVDELTREQTIDILKHAAPSFVQHYNNKVFISDNVLSEVAAIADQYSKAGSHRPDNALTLLDRAMGAAIIERHVMEQQAQNDPVLLRAIQSVPTIQITESTLKTTAMKLMTGHAKQEILDIDELKKRLSVIRGQDDITAKIVKIIKRRERTLFPEKKTPLTFLFAGVSGVGKTEVSKILADVMTHSKPITLNMTEYHSPASINRIIGSPAGYVGSDSNAELPFDTLESNPYQIILLDEFEKCDKSVQRLFMSAFDEGYIKTNKGKTVDFSKSIIIATTNAAHESNSLNSIGFTENNSKNTAQQTVDNLSEYFDIALLNRFRHILTFSPIERETYKEILANKYKTEIARIKSYSRYVTLPDELDDSELEKLTNETYVPKFGARPINQAVEEYIEENI